MSDISEHENESRPFGNLTEIYGLWFRADPLATVLCSLLIVLGLGQSLLSTVWTVSSAVTWLLVPLAIILYSFWWRIKKRRYLFDNLEKPSVHHKLGDEKARLSLNIVIGLIAGFIGVMLGRLL